MSIVWLALSHKRLEIPKNIAWVLASFVSCLIPSLIHLPPLDHWLFGFSRLMAFVLFFLIVQQGKRDAFFKYFSTSLIFLAAIESLVLLVNLILGKGVTGYLFGNPAYSASLIGSGVLMLITFLPRAPSPTLPPHGGRNIFIIAAFLTLFLISLWLLRSRAVWTGLGCAIFMIFIDKKWKPRLAFFLITMMFTFFLVFPRILYSFIKIDPSNLLVTFNENILGRMVIWKTALLAIIHRPLSGYGLDNFEEAYRLFQQPAPEPLRFMKTTMFAHNDYLQLAVEVGLPALVVCLWMLGTILIPVVKKKELSPDEKGVCAIVIMGFVSSLFSFNYYLPLNGLILAGSLGYLCPSRNVIPTKAGIQVVNPPLRNKFKAWIPAFAGMTNLVATNSVFIFVFILNVFLLLNGGAEVCRRRNNFQWATRLMPIRSDIWFEWAKTDLNSLESKPLEGKAVDAVLDKLAHALKWNSCDPFIWSRMAKVELQFKPQNHMEIERAFRMCTNVAPAHAPSWMDQGFYYYAQNNFKESWNSFLKTAKLEPNTALPYFGLGLIQMRMGEKKQAKALFERALRNAKTYGTFASQSPYADYLLTLPAPQQQAMERLLNEVH